MSELPNIGAKVVDPYLLWAIHTDYRGLSQRTQDNGKRRLTLVVDVRPQAAGSDAPSPVGASGHPSLGGQPNQGVTWSRRFRIAMRTPEDIIAYIDKAPGPFELSVPRRTEIETDDYSFSMSSAGLVRNPVLAVIDHGFAFAHEAFRRWQDGMWQTRIVEMWDQDYEEPLRERQSRAVPYGRVIKKKHIDRWLAKETRDGIVDEDAIYRAASYQQADRRLAHGTHVLGLALGRPGDTDLAAVRASVLLVQLPRRTVSDTSGAAMTSQVLQALDFIQSRVDPSSPLVVNLSYAAASGPHTGDTLLEKGMDDFIAHRSSSARTAIVLPAGNGYESDTHAQVRLTAAVSTQTVSFLVAADDPTDTFIEVWYTGPVGIVGELHVSVRGPDGTAVGPVGPDEHLFDGQRVGVIHRSRSVCNPDRSIAVIALAPTSHEAKIRCVPGVWQFTVSCISPGSSGVTVDAWIQRDDASLGEPYKTRQARFVSTRARDHYKPDDPADPVKRIGTSNGFSHGLKTMVVGACQSKGGLTRYTAAAPTGVAQRRDSQAWPDIIAVGETSRELPGMKSIGTRGSAKVRMGGTSVAAPQVARALLNEFCEGRS